MLLQLPDDRQTIWTRGCLQLKIKILFFLWFALIVFFSVVPGKTHAYDFLHRFSLTDSGFFLHVFGYLVLSFLAIRVFGEKRIWLCLAGILLVGLALEIIQIALPTRTFNPYDLLANATGVGIIGLKTLVGAAER